jgi:decaprenylphospho-beta-D-erythro-pentofuranosid-2-ulose 2-reductase
MTTTPDRLSRVIVLGSLSTIAEALARRLASEGAELVLSGRSAERLNQQADDLRARGSGKIVVVPLDLAQAENAQSDLCQMVDALGGEVDAVLLFYGVLGDQKVAETDFTALRRILDVNFTSAAMWCVAAAGILERQRKGALLAISSVAGDRGRQSNYAYGAAKAGLTTLMEGIAHRLAPAGARAVVVKLGFVDTAMTAHIKKDGPLWAKPDAIAAQLEQLLLKRSPPVVYVPWFWRGIMAGVRSLPASIFHRTKL